MKKKIVCFVLCAGLAVTYSGCGSAAGDTDMQGKVMEDSRESTEENENEQVVGTSLKPDEKLKDIIPQDTVTLDVYSQITNFEEMQEGWFAQVMLDKFNVKLNIVSDKEDSTYENRAATGDLGDIVIFGNDTEQYHSALTNGLLLNWEQNDYLGQYGSYIQDNMGKALDKNRQNSGGQIYGFGYDVALDSGEIADFSYHPDIRWDLYEQIGAPEVNTLEDYVDVLAKMKEICPESDTGEETYGASLFSDWDGDMVMFVKSTCTNFFGLDEFGLGFYDVDTGAFQGCLQDDGAYLRCLKFYNELYRNGLLDPDSRTQSYDDCIKDYQEGDAFFCIFGWLAAPQYNTVVHKADGKAMLPLAAKDQDTLVYGLNPNGGNRLWTIGSATEYPELCMAIINWLCTPEGRLVSEYGPQGVCWDYDVDGNTCIFDFGYKVKNGNELDMPADSGYEGKWQDGMPMYNNTTWALDTTNPDSNGQTYNYEYWPNVLALSKSEIEEDWREAMGADSAKEYLMQFSYSVSKPNTYTAGEKSEELGNEWSAVSDCIKNGSWDAIYADTPEEFDAIVAQMKQDAEASGYADCVSWCENEAALRKASEE